MKKLAGITLTVALIVGSGLSVQAAPPAEHGPGCADVIGGNDSYGRNPNTGQGQVIVRIVTDKGTCKQFGYTLEVFDDASMTSSLGSLTRAGDGRTELFLAVQTLDDDDTVCVAVHTGNPNHTFDHAPDAGCIEISQNTSSGQTYF